ncbi:hypothetical protein Tco_0345136 [Tanacetum coccineum]
MLDNKKFRISVEVFHEILQICPRLHKHKFVEPPSNEEIVTFIKEIGYKGDLESITELFTDHMYQPWRTFASIINKYGKKLRSRLKTDKPVLQDVQTWPILDSQVSGKLIPDVMVNDAIKDSTTYQTYCSYSTGVAIPKKARKGTKAANVPKKKDSLIFNDNIITDNPDVALELGKSISKSEAEEQEEARRVHETHKCLAISRLTLKNQSRPTNVRAEDKSNQEAQVKELDEEDDKRIDIQEIDYERTEFDNDDVEMEDVTKTNVDKAEEEENAERAKEEKKEEELKGDDQPKNEQEVGPVTVIHKDKLVLLQSTSSHSVSSNFVPVSVISTPATLPTTPPPITPPPATITEDSIPPSSEFKTLIAALQTLSIVEREVQELKQEDMEKAKTVETPTQKKRSYDDKDQDPPAGPDQGLKKRKTIEEIVFEAADTDIPLNQEDIASNTMNNPMMRLLERMIEQSWLNDLANPEKPPLTFDELMSTPIDFFAFSMNRLKISKLTKANLVGPVYNLLKGTCKSFVELEYNIEECYQALSDQLDWNNPEGNHCPYDLSKPLPLHESRGRLTIPTDFFFINDLEYRRTKSIRHQQLRQRLQRISHWEPKRQRFYGHLINRVSRHDVYSTMRILSVTSVTVYKWFGYGRLKEIVVRRADHKLYKFIEGDFPRLHLNDIEDMLLLVVQNRLNNLEGDVIFDLAVALRMYTRRIVIQKRVKDLQLGVESY